MSEKSLQVKKGEQTGRMDLSCNETMINDENEYNLYVEYQSEEKPTTSASLQDHHNQQQQPTQQKSSGIAKLYSNACNDPTFLRDRCLKNLLVSQKRYRTPSCTYFGTTQKSLTPQMRKIVAEWVIEVSFFYLIFLTVSFVSILQILTYFFDYLTEKKN